MPFKRPWDSSCPRVWNSWESNGTRWVVQDLAPEDDEEALGLLLNHLIPDEKMCIESDFTNDKESLESAAQFWRPALATRFSLACYAEKDGKRTLAAMNCCVVVCQEDKKDDSKILGAAWRNVYFGMSYLSDKGDLFNTMGVDKYLYGMGLVVRREYRGAKLGSKVLEARAPLCKAVGLKATATIFSGPASQASARRAGFQMLLTATLRDLAAAGLKYPEEDWVIALMYIVY